MSADEISIIHSRLLRCSNAKGCSAGLSLISPTKVEARKTVFIP